ncbi:DNA-binding helix-turn-helix protein [Peptoanaerobacter stomatis]|uniref:DNA-binding helix-turn-helix protein n=1 Tax=Peptoanaerobacter stomatis TaxID=796937 RepID=J6HA50_9FIRM|nr:helix-turn-helix transcriptional regulator [Peptoanaerobacter stomatis]EJU22040.1 DNA-binding helix-turn-helix protein [Peptoanaerobacter stomatis]
MNTLDRIKLLVEQKGITIAELERRADIGNGVIRRWGTSLPTGDKLQRVARELNVTIDYLVNGEEDSKTLYIGRKASNLTDEDLELIDIMIDQLLKKNNKE